MKREIKVGDKVKLVSLENTKKSWGHVEGMLCIGDVGVVAEICSDEDVYLKDGHTFLYHIDDFILTDDEECVKAKYKIGDKVRVVKSNHTEEWFDVYEEDIIGVVTDVDKDAYIDKYKVHIDGYDGLYMNGDFAFEEEHLELVEENSTDDVKPLSSPVQKTPIESDGKKISVLSSFEDFSDKPITLSTKDYKPIESDGGSSSYYFTKLPKWMIDQIVETGGIEIKDIVYFVFDNDAHAKDIIKAQKRIIEQRKGGGKAGLKPLNGS